VGKKPAFQYYPSDFDRDTAAVSLSGRGAWISLLNAMWFSQNRGELTLSIVGYARLLRATVEQTVTALNELIEFHVCDAFFEQGREQRVTTLQVTESNVKVTLVNRRMDREEKIRKSTAFRVAKHRARHGNVSPPADVTSPSSILQSSSVNTNVFTGNKSPPADLSPAKTVTSLKEPAEIPKEIAFVRRLMRRFPPKDLWAEITRALHGQPEDAIARAYVEWRKRHYSPENFGWLDWVEHNAIPPRLGAPGGRRGAPCADCQQKAEWRLAHWLTFPTEEDFKQHLLQTWPPDEAQQKFVENVKWWRTKRTLQDQERNRD
jgi:hypothetical protein